jgi:hypothetical protein
MLPMELRSHEVGQQLNRDIFTLGWVSTLLKQQLAT